jgi:ABC-type uncharacterized transport system auxiliary subunit
MRLVLLGLVTLATLAGCATTTSGPTPAGNNTYIMSRQTGMFPSGKEPLLAEVLTEVNAFCASLKKTTKVINISENMQPVGNFPKATVLFSCE